MKLSYNWLKQYVEVDLPPNEVTEILTNTGLEVEGIENFESVKGGLEGIVIGQVIMCKKHPNADKLSITKVNIGDEQPLDIVCGAPNVSEGQKVVVAKVGTTLTIDDKEVVLKKVKIRGEKSEGMICAEDEVGMGDSHDGIMVLPDNATIGMEAKDYFNIEKDTVFEIGLTPNRIDGASHIGAARDLAAYLNLKKDTPCKRPSVDDFKVDNINFTIDIKIDNPDACPRYTGVTLTNIGVAPSPIWLQNKLKAIGQKPINNLVDISNYVLHETGQPLHFFDADKIKGGKVIIKTLKDGTTFKTLDEEKRKLSGDDLMICNQEEGMCIAGVFGGAESGVTESTKNVFIESAHFNPVYIRKTSKRHLLHTDASFRFERGSDPNATVYALKRAALLIKEIAGGEISSEIIDIYPKEIKPDIVTISFKNIYRLAGKEIPVSTITRILESLDIKVLGKNDKELILEIPTYRVDVTREADVIEEILRIYGYNNIEISNRLKASITHSREIDAEKIKNKISDYLSAQGFNEIMCNSLTRLDYYENLISFPEKKSVKIFNPLSNDLNAMRQSLLFGGLESIVYNQNRKSFNLRFYEFGNCYFRKNKKNENELSEYEEEFRFSMLITGNKEEKNWITKGDKSDFFYLKSYVNNLLEFFGIADSDIAEKEIKSDIFLAGISYTINQIEDIVQFGMVEPDILQNFDIDDEVFYADFYWAKMLQLAKKNKIKYQKVPKFPVVKRDLAILIDKQVAFNQIKSLITRTEKKFLKDISIFDVYEGKNIEPGKKSYAISIYLQDENKTLKDKQIDKIMKIIMNVLEKELNAQIRQ